MGVIVTRSLPASAPQAFEKYRTIHLYMYICNTPYFDYDRMRYAAPISELIWSFRYTEEEADDGESSWTSFWLTHRTLAAQLYQRIWFLGCQQYRYYIEANEQLPVVLVTGLLGEAMTGGKQE